MIKLIDSGRLFTDESTRTHFVITSVGSGKDTGPNLGGDSFPGSIPRTSIAGRPGEAKSSSAVQKDRVVIVRNTP